MRDNTAVHLTCTAVCMQCFKNHQPCSKRSAGNFESYFYEPEQSRNRLMPEQSRNRLIRSVGAVNGASHDDDDDGSLVVSIDVGCR